METFPGETFHGTVSQVRLQEAIGEREPTPAHAQTHGVREVWEYHDRQFTPIAVHPGLADGGWTELVSGDLRAGDVLVTSASRSSRP